LECVGVAGGVAGLPCASADSRSSMARSSHIASSLSSLLTSAMAMASFSLMFGGWVFGSHANVRRPLSLWLVYGPRRWAKIVWNWYDHLTYWFGNETSNKSEGVCA
jgi:hypothetical protein